MTIKELLVMVEQSFSIFSEPITDERLQSILDGATLYHRDWSNRPDILTCEKALIDTSKGGIGGIIVSEKTTGDRIKMSQYALFQAWRQKKCATDLPSDVPADDVSGVDASVHGMPKGRGEADGRND